MTENRKKDLPILPYPGIEPFSYNERNVFFARGDELRTFIRMVVIYRGVLLYSESGTGKSSFINAGLIPRAIEEGFQPERVRIQPKVGHELVINRISNVAKDSKTFLPSLFAGESDDEQIIISIEQFIKQIESKGNEYWPLVIFDQFEEWITLFEEEARGKDRAPLKQSQNKIADVIVSLLNDHSLKVKIVISLREDYLAKLAPILRRCQYLGDQSLQLQPLQGDNIKQIIRGPFVKFPGFYHPEIEEVLADQINAQFEGRDPGSNISLSEVQIVCKSLFESNKSTEKLEGYFEKCKGVKGLLEKYLENTLGSLDEEQRDPAIGLLSRMVTFMGTRNVISYDNLLALVQNVDKIPRGLLISTLKSLESDARLVKREHRGGVDYYEIHSEFLIDWILKKSQERVEKRKIEEVMQRVAIDRKKRRKQVVVGAGIGLLIILIATLGLIWSQFQINTKNYAIEKFESEKKAREALMVDNLFETANVLIKAGYEKEAYLQHLKILEIDSTTEVKRRIQDQISNWESSN